MPDGAIHPLSAEQVLLKGSILRNTSHVYGIACYTGHQTKVMKNSLKARVKKSKIELQTNIYLIIIVGVQMFTCCLSAIINMIFTAKYKTIFGYLYYDYTLNDGALFALSFFQWFILLANFVSISLLVTLEMCKLFQAYFIMSDWRLYDIEKDMFSKVNSSNLNEELGMVSYIFSDKTGTLTQNIMEFQKFSCGGIAYGKSDPKPFKYPPGVTNVNFEDDRVFEHLDDTAHPNHENLKRFIECLGICHTVISDDKEAKGEKFKIYNASSPDELALVNGMRHFGFAFDDRDVDDNMIVKMTRLNTEVKYKLLHVIEFNSDRKRMSVIVRDAENRLLIVCKGADSIISARLAPNQEHQPATQADVEKYAEVGLRTLLIAYKYIDEDYYEEWLEKYTKASQSTGDREKEVGLVAE